MNKEAVYMGRGKVIGSEKELNNLDELGDHWSKARELFKDLLGEFKNDIFATWAFMIDIPRVNNIYSYYSALNKRDKSESNTILVKMVEHVLESSEISDSIHHILPRVNRRHSINTEVDPFPCKLSKFLVNADKKVSILESDYGETSPFLQLKKVLVEK